MIQDNESIKEVYVPVMAVLKILDNGKKDKQIHFIRFDDIDYIESDGRRTLFHVGEDTYIQPMTKSDYEEFFMEYGNFESLDRPNLVNLNHICHFDAEMGKVYFKENPTPHSKFATVARIKSDLVNILLREAIANNKGQQLELKPRKSGRVTLAIQKLFGFLPK